MATITHPTGNGYCRDRVLRDRPIIGAQRRRMSIENGVSLLEQLKFENASENKGNCHRSQICAVIRIGTLLGL